MKKSKSKLNEVADGYSKLQHAPKGPKEGSPAEEASESPDEEIAEDGPEAAKKPEKKAPAKKNPFKKSM